MHEIAIEQFGGSHGVRDAGLIESAVAEPMQTFDGVFLLDGIESMAAAYWHGLAKNHWFVDGNKRVALLVADAFLQFNGQLLTLSDDEVERITLNVATGELGREQLAQIIRENVVPLDT